MNNLYKEMVRKPGDLCFEVSLESDKGLTMTDLSFALKFFVYGHPKNVCIHKDDLEVVEGKYYAVLNEHGFVNGVLFCEAEIVETINGINRIVSVRSNTGYMIGNCCQSSVDTSSCAHGYSLSLYKVEYVPQPIDPNPEEDQLVAEELFGERLSLPELTADRAIADEHGNRIADTYETRQAVRNHIREVYNEQFIENPPLILDEYITPGMLSEGVKDMLSKAGATITNVPDGEDLTTKKGVLKLSDKPYNPGAYSGLGRVYLRKNLVGGQNLLTQAMVSKPNTIYILQYDYTLDGKSITIPEGCVLSYEGGSIRDGHINYTDTLIKGIVSLNNVIETGNVKYYPLRADEEDLTTEGGKHFKFADKQYAPQDYSGLGRIYLRKNMVEGKNILTQEMISKPNTIYIIQYDYDLNGAEIAIPGNCVLQFEGGMMRNGRVYFDRTELTGNIKAYVKPLGVIINKIVNCGWFGLDTEANDNSQVISDVSVLCNNRTNTLYIPLGDFKVENVVDLFGVYNVIIDGRIVNDVNSPVIIGANAINTYSKNYKINDVDFIEVHGGNNSFVEIKRSLKCLIYSDGEVQQKSRVTYSTFNFGLIEELLIKGKNGGWITENAFYNGRTPTLTIQGDYSHNNNSFYHFRLEKANIRIENGHSNKFYNCRFEYDNTIYFGEGTFDNVFYRSLNTTANKSLLSIGYLSNCEIVNEGFDSNIVTYDFSGKHVEKILSITKDFKGINLADGYPTNRGLFMKNSKDLATSSPIPLKKDFAIYLSGDNERYRISLTFFDKDGNMVELTEIPSWVYSFNYLTLNSGILTGKSNSNNINLQIDASKNTDDSIKFVSVRVYTGSSYSGEDKEITTLNVYAVQSIRNEVAIHFPIRDFYTSIGVPSEGVYQIGDKVFATDYNKFIYYTGEKWVDATGTEV